MVKLATVVENGKTKKVAIKMFDENEHVLYEQEVKVLNALKRDEDLQIIKAID